MSETEQHDEQVEAARIVELETAMFAAGKLAFMPSRRRKTRCRHCDGVCIRSGRDRHGRQRWKCRVCKRMTFAASTPRLLDGFHTSDLKIQMLVHLIAEGISLRGASRVVKLANHTVHKIHKLVGSYCMDFMKRTIVGIPASDVEVDETWTYVMKKQFRKSDLEKKNHKVGSAWIYIGIDRSTKLILAFHIGRRTVDDACEFMKKLRAATVGQMTIYTDGFQPYPTAVYAAFLYENDLSALPDFMEHPAVVVRNNGMAGMLHHCESLDYTKACTNQVERFNGTLRGSLKRMARRTQAFSKTWTALEHGVSIFLAYYNFCKVHGALAGKTPAMQAGLTDRPWTIRDLLLAARPAESSLIEGRGVPASTVVEQPELVIDQVLRKAAMAS